MSSSEVPRPVLTLCGPSVVRLLSEWRGGHGPQPVDVAALRQDVIKATGITVSGSVPFFTPLQDFPLTQTRRADLE